MLLLCEFYDIDFVIDASCYCSVNSMISTLSLMPHAITRWILCYRLCHWCLMLFLWEFYVIDNTCNRKILKGILSLQCTYDTLYKPSVVGYNGNLFHECVHIYTYIYIYIYYIHTFIMRMSDSVIGSRWLPVLIANIVSPTPANLEVTELRMCAISVVLLWITG